MLSVVQGSAIARATALRRLRRPTGASISSVTSSTRGGDGCAARSAADPNLRSFSTRLPHQFNSSLAPGRGLLSLAPRRELRRAPCNPTRNTTVRTNFSYAGPRKLSDIVDLGLLENHSAAEISDIWMTYHEEKENVHGLIINEAKGKSILSRAAECPFFIHPVFREEGHFMIISQFQAPNYFLLAFLEDYQMDPARAQPLLTVSVFDDLAEKDVTLVRCDIINRGIEEDEGYKICKCLLDDYTEDEDFQNVNVFNKKPEAFDVDTFVKEKEIRWKGDSRGAGDELIDAAAKGNNDKAV